jgi:hypothetical protein
MSAFPWRLNRSTNSANLEHIWEKSVNGKRGGVHGKSHPYHGSSSRLGQVYRLLPKAFGFDVPIIIDFEGFTLVYLRKE